MLELFAYLLVALICAPFILAFIMGGSIILTFLLGCLLVPYSFVVSLFQDN